MNKPPVLNNLSTLSVKKRRDLARRAHLMASSGEFTSKEAQVVLAGIAEYEFALFRDRRIVVGVISWEPFEYQYEMRGFDGDKVVAQIIYTATHGTIRKEVFQLVVLGEPIEDAFHHVPDARVEGAKMYTKKIACQ